MVKIWYQDKDKEEFRDGNTHLKNSKIVLNSEQVDPCISAEIFWISTPMIVAYAALGLVFLFILCISFRNKNEKIKEGLDINPEYGAEYYFKQGQEAYGGSVQYEA